MWQQNKDFLQKHRGWELKAFLIAELLEGVGKEEKEPRKREKVGSTSPSLSSCDSTEKLWESIPATPLHSPHLHHKINFYYLSYTYSGYSLSFHFPTLLRSAWNNIYSVSFKKMKQSWLVTSQSCLQWLLLFTKGGQICIYSITCIHRACHPRAISGKYSQSLDGSPVWRCVYTSSPLETQWVGEQQTQNLPYTKHCVQTLWLSNGV